MSVRSTYTFPHTHTHFTQTRALTPFLSHSLTHNIDILAFFRLKLAVFNYREHVCDKSIHNPVIDTHISYIIVTTQCTHWLLSTHGADNVIKIYYVKPLTCISTSARISSTCYCWQPPHMWCICTSLTKHYQFYFVSLPDSASPLLPPIGGVCMRKLFP